MQGPKLASLVTLLCRVRRIQLLLILPVSPTLHTSTSRSSGTSVPHAASTTVTLTQVCAEGITFSDQQQVYVYARVACVQTTVFQVQRAQAAFAQVRHRLCQSL